MLPELFDHQDQNVRASSKGVTLELCRWIGKDPVKSILFEKMRDTMVRKSSIGMLILVNSCFYLSGNMIMLSRFLLFKEKRVGGRACQCHRVS